jgi:hypothetical protein
MRGWIAKTLMQTDWSKRLAELEDTERERACDCGCRDLSDAEVAPEAEKGRLWPFPSDRVTCDSTWPDPSATVFPDA